MQSKVIGVICGTIRTRSGRLLVWDELTVQWNALTRTWDQLRT